MALGPLAVGDLIAAMWTSPRNVRLVKSARFKCRVGWCLHCKSHSGGGDMLFLLFYVRLDEAAQGKS